MGNAQDEREKRILDAAVDLTLRYGYDKTTVSDIAKAAGISKGAIYLHYKSKDDLFEAMAWREIYDYTDQMIVYLEDETQTWSFVGMYSKALEVIGSNALLSAMIQGDDVMGAFLQRRGGQIGAMKRPYQSQLLELMQQAGTIRADLDIEATTYLLNMLNLGFIEVQRNIAADERPSMDRVITAQAEMLQRYLIPDDGGDQEAGRQIMLNMSQQIRVAMQDQFNQHTTKDEE